MPKTKRSDITSPPAGEAEASPTSEKAWMQVDESILPLLRLLPDPVIIYDAQDKVMFVNQAFEDTYGWSEPEVTGRRINYVPAGEQSLASDMALRAMAGEKIVEKTKRITKTGVVIPVEISLSLIHDNQGNHLGSLVLHKDLTSRLAKEARIAKTKARYLTLMNAIPDPVIIYDSEGRATYTNAAFEKTYGWTREEFLNSNVGFVPPEEHDTVEQTWLRTLAGENVLVDTKRLTKDGRTLYIQLHTAVTFDNNGTHQDSIVIHRDITRLKEAEERQEKYINKLSEMGRKLAKLSFADGLTGLGNRRLFDQRLEQEWRRAKRNQKTLAMLMLDIDYFKNYNDTFGHQKGDECLKKVARAIDGCLHRGGDMAARFGGEEFAVLLPITDKAGALIVAEKMRLAVLELELEHPASQAGLVVSVSAGVAALKPDENNSPAELVKKADQALYQAKQSGRNRATVSPD